MGLYKNADGEFQIRTISNLDYEEAYYRLKALVGVLQEADFDMITKDEVYYTCSMIRDLLPSLDDFMILNRYHSRN